ncbi:Homeodomain-like protein [Macrophomina phaseolina]|uniref:Homeodomain-like protein n=1 Tax=Macrophomina phaseolina TaxID=35725 RepID=A0ABQ8FYX6_9PEZI|nr:Homeodomain-like protein [Macrophomina phaseolina]
MSRAAKKWTPEEDAELLRQATLQFSKGKAKNWNAIARSIPDRSNKDCRKRWCNHLVGGLRKGSWDPSEDRRLSIGVKEYGLQWPLVAEEVGTRSADQCAKRWQHSLDPNLDHSKWTKEEEEKLLRVVEERGRAWKQIQTLYFPGRAANNVKNRYVTLTRKQEAQSGESLSQDASNSNGENDVGDAGGDRTPSASPGATMGPVSDEEVPARNVEAEAPSNHDHTLVRDDGMQICDNYGGQARDDPFSFDLSTNTIFPSMDLDPTTADAFTWDMPLDFNNTNYMPATDDSMSADNGNGAVYSPDTLRHDSTSTFSQPHSGIHFSSTDSTDALSMLKDLEHLHRNDAEFILTIENPSHETITSLMNVLVPSKTKFRMEMK